MNIYRFTFPNEETAVKHFVEMAIATKEKDEEFQYLEGTYSIVNIPVVSEKATFDEKGEILTEQVLAEGVHYDIMTDIEVKSEFLVEPKTPQHNFAGHEKVEVEVLEKEVIVEKIQR
jgi:hypothetical protein